MRAGRCVPASLWMPPRIWAMSNRCSQVCGLFKAFVIKSAICCLVLTYNMRIRGFEQTSNSHCRSMRWVRGKCRIDIDLAFLVILITASLSSAMTGAVVWPFVRVCAKYFPG